MENSAASRVARLLTLARRTGNRLGGLAGDIEPVSVEQGYDVQLASWRMDPAPVAGYKVGLTSERAQQGFGVSSPIAGYLSGADMVRGPLRLGLDPGHLAVVEAEVVFELGRDLPFVQAPFSDRDIDACIAGAFAGIEICDSRFADTNELPLPWLIADNAFADRVVIGDRLRRWDRSKLDSLSVTLQVGARPAVAGSTAHVLGNPLRSLCWLANWLASRGQSLLAGQFVASGSCTGITSASRDDLVTATFGSGACASVQFLGRAGRGAEQ